MIDSKNILSLLSIPCEDVLSYEVISDKENTSYIEIELKDKRENCPFCLSNQIVIKDYYNVQIKNSIIRNQKLYVRIRVRRYKCKCCSKTFKQSFPLYSNNNIISDNIKNTVRIMLMKRVSMEYIASELDISKTSVMNILDQMPEPQRIPLENVICLDEFHFSNANKKVGQYPCVISSPFKTEIIDIIE